MVGDRSRNSSFTVGADATPKPRSLKFSIPDTYQALKARHSTVAAAPLIEAARYGRSASRAQRRIGGWPTNAPASIRAD